MLNDRCVFSYTNLFEVFASVFRNEGFVALYRGALSSLVGVLPYSGCVFFTYESLKNFRLGERENSFVRSSRTFAFRLRSSPDDHEDRTLVVRRRFRTHRSNCFVSFRCGSTAFTNGCCHSTSGSFARRDRHCSKNHPRRKNYGWFVQRGDDELVQRSDLSRRFFYDLWYVDQVDSSVVLLCGKCLIKTEILALSIIFFRWIVRASWHSSISRS